MQLFLHFFVHVFIANVLLVPSLGQGVFGYYAIDTNGLPVFNFTLNSNLPWKWSLSGQPFNLNATTHWHVVGNYRYNSLPMDMGYIEMYTAERGGAFINKFDVGYTNNVLWSIGNDSFADLQHVGQDRVMQQQTALLQDWRSRHNTAMDGMTYADTENSAVTTPRLSGGFSYIRMFNQGSTSPTANDTAFCAAYMLAPPNKTETAFTVSEGVDHAALPQTEAFERLFGVGYATHSGTFSAGTGATLTVTHTWRAPNSVSQLMFPILIDDVTLRLEGGVSTSTTASHWEYFSVNFQQLQTQLTRTFVAGVIGDAWRAAINGFFNQSVYWTEIAGANRIYQAVLSTSQVSERYSGTANCSCNYGEPPQACPPVMNARSTCGVDYFPPQIALILLQSSDNSSVSDVVTSATQFFNAPSPIQPVAACASVSRMPGVNASWGCPAAVLQGSMKGQYRPWNASDAAAQEGIMAMQTIHTFRGPDSSIKLSFAFAYIPYGSSLQDLAVMLDSITVPPETPAPHNNKNSSKIASQGNSGPTSWQNKLLSINIPDGESNQPYNETVWRSNSLLSMATYRDSFDTSFIPQGSGYLYLHGLDGAPRDCAISVLAAVWLDPNLARGTLQMIMAMQDASTAQFWYSLSGGYNTVSNAIIHAKPSDLDIYFLWGVQTYLSATGDFAFLSANYSYYYDESARNSVKHDDSMRATAMYPPGAAGTTVLDHIRAAFTHLTQAVGVGEHGCIRVLEGDWDDGITVDAGPDPVALLYTMLYGESIPNCQMAAFVLPRIAECVVSMDPELAANTVSFAASLRAPARNAYGSGWFGRAWFKDAQNVSYLYQNDGSNAVFNNNDSVLINLQSQVWALLDAAFPLPGNTTPLLNTTEVTALLDVIDAQLWNTSMIGPRLTPVSGQVWPAISQLYTIATSVLSSARSSSSLQQHTYAAHAAAFPTSWVGVMSAPDGLVASVDGSTDTAAVGGWDWGFYSDAPGYTWGAPVTTPMTDFPVGNSNPDAMFIVASLASVGVTAGWHSKNSFAACPVTLIYACNAPSQHLVNTVVGNVTSAGLIVVDLDAALYERPSGVIVAAPTLSLNITGIGGITGTFTSFAAADTTILIVKTTPSSDACTAVQLNMTPQCRISFQI